VTMMSATTPLAWNRTGTTCHIIFRNLSFEK
jgi:hypothetical protein